VKSHKEKSQQDWIERVNSSAHQIVPNPPSEVVRSIGHPKMASSGTCAI